MSDVFTKKQRSDVMRAVRAFDTKPEMVVRKIAHRLGYRYRLHVRTLPGKPDLVFGPRKKVIFVHGCFWHRHNCSYGRSMPSTRILYWRGKFKRNVARDRKARAMLRKSGWQVLIVWECVTRKQDVLEQRLAEFLGPCSNRAAAL